MAGKPLYVPLEDDERELLLRLLDTVGFELLQCRDAQEPETDVLDIEREEAQVETLYERIEQHIPLTRADVLRALRLVGNLPTIGWQPEKATDARRLHAVLKARCTNVLRLARQGA